MSISMYFAVSWMEPRLQINQTATEWSEAITGPKNVSKSHLLRLFFFYVNNFHIKIKIYRSKVTTCSPPRQSENLPSNLISLNISLTSKSDYWLTHFSLCDKHFLLAGLFLFGFHMRLS